MKRLMLVMVVVAACFGFSGATAAEECFTSTVDVDGCVSIDETGPIVAGAGVSSPAGTHIVRLGFVIQPAGEIGDCSPTHVGQIPCVRLVRPGLYEILVSTDSPFGLTGVHAIGSPAPCIEGCTYDTTVRTGRVIRPVTIRACYDAPSANLAC